MKKLFVFGLLLISALLIFCSTKNQPSVNKRAVYGGTLKIASLGSLENLDPQKIIFYTDLQVSSLVYEGLVTFKEKTYDAEPLLAKTWKISEDGRKIIFTLQDNTYFQDDQCFSGGKGRQLVADDVRYTFERMADPSTKCPNWYLFSGKIKGIDDYYNSLADSISGIVVLNKEQVEFHLTKPWFNFLKILATSSAYIIPREAVEFYNENFNKHPVGTGPFRLTDWKQLEHLVFVKNKNYWRKDGLGESLPFLDFIYIRLISNPILQISEFLKGNLHLLKANERRYQKLQKEEGFWGKYKVANSNQAFNIRFLGFSMNKEAPVSGWQNLRQAIAIGFNRSAIVTEKEIHPKLAQTLVPDFLLNNPAKQWYNYNPVLARKIINGNRASKKKAINISTNIEAKELRVLKESCEKLGLKCSINLKKDRYYPHIIKDRPDIFRVSFHPSYPDPEEYYALFYSKNSSEVNLFGYNNPQFDMILEQLVKEQNKAIRQQLFNKLEKILKEDVPALYLNYPEFTYCIVPKYVYGLKIRFNISDFSQVWMEPQNANEN